MGALPSALLRDDAADFLDGGLALLEKHDYPVDPLTPKMHAMLANAVAHRPLLHEALGHLQQRTARAYSVHCLLAPTAVAQLLAIAARDQQIPTVIQELQRLRAMLETTT